VSRLALHLLGLPRFERDCEAQKFDTPKVIPRVTCPAWTIQTLLN
jgi:hypothetical protein